MPQFHHMMGERLRSVEQGADTVVWLALSRVAARTRSGQFFQGEQHEVWQVSPLHIYRDVPFIFFFLPPILCGEFSSDRLFVLQIAGLFPLTCLWPGLTALQRKSRGSWLSWRLWPESSSRNLTWTLTEPWTRPDLNLSELWHKCYTVCHWPIKALVITRSISESVGILVVFNRVCLMCLLILSINVTYFPDSV